MFESKRRRIEEAELQYVKKKGKATQEAVSGGRQSPGGLLKKCSILESVARETEKEGREAECRGCRQPAHAA